MNDIQVSPFSTPDAFESAQRMAKAMATSTMLPEGFREVGNLLVAMDLARSLGVTVFTVANNMDMIHGKPAAKATFVIGCVNSSGKFSPLKYRWFGTAGKDDFGARAVATRVGTGEECVGPLVDIGMAKAEGWYGRAGSKWKTMPEVMIGYRAATFWARLYCPEIMQGIPQTSDEVFDIGQPRNVTPEVQRIQSPVVQPVVQLGSTPVVDVQPVHEIMEPFPPFAGNPVVAAQPVHEIMEPFPPFAGNPVVAAQPAPTPSIEDLRVATAVACKEHGLSWDELKATGILFQWWPDPEKMTWKKLNADQLQHLLDNIAVIADGIRTRREIPAEVGQ